MTGWEAQKQPGPSVRHRRPWALPSGSGSRCLNRLRYELLTPLRERHQRRRLRRLRRLVDQHVRERARREALRQVTPARRDACGNDHLGTVDEPPLHLGLEFARLLPVAASAQLEDGGPLGLLLHQLVQRNLRQLRRATPRLRDETAKIGDFSPG